RSRIGGAAGKQIAVTRLAVEQRYRVRERGLRGDLARGLTVVVEQDGRCARRALDRLSDVDHPLQREIDDVEPRVDVRRGVSIGVDAACLRAQTERKTEIGALPRISRRDPAAGKLLR